MTTARGVAGAAAGGGPGVVDGGGAGAGSSATGDGVGLPEKRIESPRRKTAGDTGRGSLRREPSAERHAPGGAPT